MARATHPGAAGLAARARVLRSGRRLAGRHRLAAAHVALGSAPPAVRRRLEGADPPARRSSGVTESGAAVRKGPLRLGDEAPVVAARVQGEGQYAESVGISHLAVRLDRT